MALDLVLVTGASGYIATHIVHQLQQQGHRVRGTVRSLKNEEKVKPLKELCPDAKYPLELVEADLLDGSSWVDAVKDCTYVIHVASPLPTTTPKYEDEVIKPAVDGTLNILRACKEEKSIKRVVVTSSIAAISYGFNDPDKWVSEKDWIDETSRQTPVYYRSKALAEKAAWDFVKDLQGSELFELAVVNPGFVTGPVICGTIRISIVSIKKILEGKVPMIPHIQACVTDVRDVAAAHIKAMIVPEAAGNRHVIIGESMWLEELVEIMAAEFNPQGYHVKTRLAPNWLLRIVSWFDRTVAEMIPLLGKRFKTDTSRMTSVLGINARTAKSSIIDMCYSMIERGLVEKAKGYTGPK